QLPPGQDVSDTVIELAGWVVATNDSEGYPFAIIDKAAAQILVFGGDGRLRGAAPGLFGSAVGDHTAPGVAGLALREIPGRDRTTPAGRFVGGYGPSIDAGRVLWVDYESAVSIHPTATGVPAEKRAERLASPTPDDNRVTHGCINVEPGFYEQIIRPTFERGGVFYVMPDEATVAETCPGFAPGRWRSRALRLGDARPPPPRQIQVRQVQPRIELQLVVVRLHMHAQPVERLVVL